MFEAAVQLRRHLLIFEATVLLRQHLLITEATIQLRRHLLVTKASFICHMNLFDYRRVLSSRQTPYQAIFIKIIFNIVINTNGKG